MGLNQAGRPRLGPGGQGPLSPQLAQVDLPVNDVNHCLHINTEVGSLVCPWCHGARQCSLNPLGERVVSKLCQ